MRRNSARSTLGLKCVGGVDAGTLSSRDPADVRDGLDNRRKTEDDIAKEKLAERGVPGQSNKAERDQDELQNPKGLDPGHTA
jgi:hypothetical protein